MALTPNEQNFVVRTQTTMKAIYEQYGMLAELNALWAGAPDYDTSITDADLDEIASLAHITVADLTEVLYIFGSLKALMDSRFEQIASVIV